QVTNAGNCSSLSNSKNVTVNAKPVAVIYTLTPTSFCQGDSVKLRTNSNIGLTYIWKKDGITILGAIDSIYTAKATGSYVVVITNVSMCNATSLPASVNVVPYPIVVVTLTGASTFCQGDSALLSTSIGSGLTYQWRNASTDILGAINNTLTVKQTGAYMVRVTNSTNCSTNSLVQNITVNPLPIVVIKPSGPVSFCMGDSVKLASDTISGLNRQWKRNGVNILNATDSIYYVTIAGSYTLQVTNASNCMATSSAKVVTVNANNLATITTLTPTTFCAGDSVKLRTNSGIGYTYIWRRDGIIIPGAIDSIYTAKVSGSYVVTINNTFGCNAISAPQLVVVVPFPIVVVVLTGPSTFCQGDSALLSTTFGVGLSYQWRNAGIDIFGATSNSLTVKQSGSYLVRVTNFNNCATNSLPQNILVNPLPTAIITSNDTNSFCQGDSIRLSANRASGLSYQWLRNNVEILNALDSFYVANTSGNYTVSITNSNSCVNTSAAYVVNVNPIPLAEITASGPLSFCIGDSITLTANNEFSYRWSTNQTTRSINVSASGAYSVTVTSIFGCKNTSLVSVVTVNPLPLALTGPDKTLVRGGSVLIGVAPVAGNSYLWTPSLGLSATDISQPRANPMDTTTYYLTETINLTGCSNTNSVRVNVVLDIEFFNGFSPNGDGFNDTWNIPILNYFPENTVTINNRWGSEVWSLKNYNSATNAWDGKNMNGDDLPDGTYFYIVTYYNTEKRGWVFIKR
ncbi:MAG: gliding motility-associated C-terminal domain-containing protein, partial [bacterium]|nr:gliding motility-associated C-terminal domain-containing protein [bacterium]